MEKATVVVRKSQMKEDKFNFEVVAKGAYVDKQDEEHQFLVETYTLRLNQIAFNEWLQSETLSCRDAFNTDQEWEDCKAKYAERRKALERKIWVRLGFGIEFDGKGAKITQSMAEVFTVVRVRKITDDLLENLALVKEEHRFMSDEERRESALNEIRMAIKKVEMARSESYNEASWMAAQDMIDSVQKIGLITNEEGQDFLKQAKAAYERVITEEEKQDFLQKVKEISERGVKKADCATI